MNDDLYQELQNEQIVDKKKTLPLTIANYVLTGLAIIPFVYTIIVFIVFTMMLIENANEESIGFFIILFTTATRQSTLITLICFILPIIITILNFKSDQKNAKINLWIIIVCLIINTILLLLVWL